jgi:5-methylcytosine-specific restriction protein B
MSPVERNALWDSFLERWPLEKLSQIKINEYTQAGDPDCFTFGWLEKITENLGSIWGGSAFKFGVYSRKDQSAKDNGSGKSYSSEYGWYSKYGTTAEEAFKQVRTIIVEIAQAARSGNLDAIEQADLGTAIKWKLAFLYQNRLAPMVLPVYSAEFLKAYLQQTSKASLSHMHTAIMAKRGSLDVLAFGQSVWEQAEARLSAEVLGPQEALAFFQNNPDRFQPIKSPTIYLAGFTTAEGRSLAVSLKQKEAKLWLEPGIWLDEVKARLKDIEVYPAERSRSSNLSANAPALDKGNPALFLTVPTLAALVTLCDAYDNSSLSESNFMPTNSPILSSAQVPLNQILYGPPGTGKTYATIDEALRILDPEFLQDHMNDRTVLKARFDELFATGHVRFVTFHQSFSYEDFVEGLRAENSDNGQLRYDVVDGVFKSLCDAAAAKVTKQAEAPIDLTGRRIWKMSLGNTLGSDAYIYDECIDKGYGLLGYGELIDFSSCKDRDQIYDRFIASDMTLTKDAYAVTAVSTFVLKMKVGDLIVVTEGNTKFRAIGEITGNYRSLGREDLGDCYGQCRDVKWLRVYKPSLPLNQLMHNQFSQMTLYELRVGSIDMTALADLLHTKYPIFNAATSHLFQEGESFGSGYMVRKVSTDLLELEKPNGKTLPIGTSILHMLADYVRSGRLTITDIRDKHVFDKVPETLLEPYLVNGYSNILPALVERLLPDQSKKTALTPTVVHRDAKVLIIDEINRGNISRIFGELITLIEPSKRAGAPEALKVTLPYSKEPFSVPSNIYLIGTMNTADRSLAGLDIALRRRFTFKEMPPKPELLDDIDIEGVNIGELLLKMNDRIEVLLDRDHCLGHAYFMPLKENGTLDNLAFIFRQQILPLLQEYFFEDWERIGWILNDQRKLKENRFLAQPKTDLIKLFGDEEGGKLLDGRWQINNEAFDRIEAYLGVIDHEAKITVTVAGREVIFEGFTVRQLESGTIEILDGETMLMPVKPKLREMAESLAISMLNGQGKEYNTRQLGNIVLDAVQAQM